MFISTHALASPKEYWIWNRYLGATIFAGMFIQLIPVWIALVVTFAVSIAYKRKLGLYGKLFDTRLG